MPKKKVSKARRSARSQIKIEIDKNLSSKDKRDLDKLKCHMKYHACGCGSAVYGLGFIGAAVYYVTTAPSIWAALIGLLKALVWPAFLVYSAMQQLGM